MSTSPVENDGAPAEVSVDDSMFVIGTKIISARSVGLVRDDGSSGVFLGLGAVRFGDVVGATGPVEPTDLVLYFIPTATAAMLCAGIGHIMRTREDPDIWFAAMTEAQQEVKRREEIRTTGTTRDCRCGQAIVQKLGELPWCGACWEVPNYAMERAREFPDVVDGLINSTHGMPSDRNRYLHRLFSTVGFVQTRVDETHYGYVLPVGHETKLYCLECGAWEPVTRAR